MKVSHVMANTTNDGNSARMLQIAARQRTQNTWLQSCKPIALPVLRHRPELQRSPKKNVTGGASHQQHWIVSGPVARCWQRGARYICVRCRVHVGAATNVSWRYCSRQVSETDVRATY